MPFKAFVLFCLASLYVTNGYVLLQVRKGGDQQNVDALIHKVLPNDKFDKIAKTARKQFRNYKQIKVNNKPDDNDLESIVFALNTATEYKPPKPKHSEKIDKMTEQIINYVSKYLLTASTNFQPEIVHFNGNKPSVIYEVNFQSILKTIKDFLSSSLVKDYTDTVAEKAAFIFRSIKEEFDKPKRQNV